MSQEEVAERLDYIDLMDEYEKQREIALYEREEKIKKALTIVIQVLVVTIFIVASYQLIKG